MTISKRELRSFFGSLHPLNVGLVFKVYKELNYNDIQFDKLSVRRNKYTTKSTGLVNNYTKSQKSNKIRVKYSEFIKYLAENLFEMNIKDLGYLQSLELLEIFQYIKENEPSINKMHNSHKLEKLIFSILKIHIIYILELSILLSEMSEIKAIIEDFSKLLLCFEINVEDLFYNISDNELIQIFNLICYFLDLKEEIILDKNQDNILIKILNISMNKIKKHFNILLQHPLKMSEIINQPNKSKWISLLDSKDIVISNEDLVLYFILKNFNGYCDNLIQVMEIIRFNFLSDSAKNVYNRVQSPVLNSTNITRNEYFVNNALSFPNSTIKPKFMILNNLSDWSQIPVINKHFVIENNLNTDGCFSYEVQIMNQGKFRFPGNFNDLVKTWHLFLGISIKVNEEFQPFIFNLFSLLCENSNKNHTDKFFRCSSILKSSKYDFKTGNISKNIMAPAPTALYKEKNYMQNEVVIQEDGLVLADSSGNEIWRDENKVIFVVNLREKFILVEIGGLFSVYIEILDSLFEYSGLQTKNNLIFPLISYNHEYFNIELNYYSCNLSMKEELTNLKKIQNQEYKNRLIGSKTRRKLLLEVSKKQSGAPKRVTRLRPSGSTNVVIPFSMDSLNSPLFSVTPPTGRRGRPKKNTNQAYIRELAYMNNMKEYCSSSLAKASKKNGSRQIPESTEVRDPGSLVIKKIKKKVKASTTNNHRYFNSFLGKLFTKSLEKLLGFFRGRLL
ncbi:hypothetical protein [Cryptosporidium parvum Iowa II]|uniref:Uncharacterized protein n=2 Tax=Cryptosporidium parvum TaxID=5807 RepID=Q5CVY4_CRYPI|nr:hypothetical protein [Cryptosporidium parvum Iowa II]EAK89428.1 hypothetical protein, potential AT hook [Cryptosporidium parvum Iowa II]QOY39988.1 Uncharacterized protein CPATCC_0002430 [Cryptosporidium parvum]WKS79485.1 hypothetical protein CPCDC_8g2320 [Cryptosporidium sp. 43IA8]WRK33985.1 Uncharacterized protein cpbgf_8002320 [Cryptosporidium parvum]|eukprot:QOY39988.1 hypothetical protein CPATCC_004056 [Cryptosporidium parvum]